MRRSDVRVVTVSTFSAGTLARTCPANVLHPGVSPAWYQTLLAASMRAHPVTGEFNVVTAFRLEDWRDKGFGTLLDAVHLLSDARVRLTVCGAGPVPPDLAARMAPHPWCRIAADLSDPALAEQLAAADVFVLATRTRFGATAYGEGFGLVLLEAQLAGTPVIAPAYGGSPDAFQVGLTGLAPIDESPEALASVLATLLSDNQRRAQMAQAAATWSRARFEPTAHGRYVVETLLAT
jgi:glycosyltransferase involved in cell wall biosynthesis